MALMTKVNGGRDLRDGRSQLRDLGEAARAFVARPGDANAARAVLAFPLEREAWEGLGPDIDNELLALTPFVGHAVRSLVGSDEAADWYDAALEPCVGAMALTEDGTEARMEAEVQVVQLLM